jgi:hypothetical protein
MRQRILALGILLMMLPGVGLTRPAVAETQGRAQKTATCTLQVEGMR